MLDKFKKWVSKKQNMNKLLLVCGALILYGFIGGNTPIQTQSVFGSLLGGFTPLFLIGLVIIGIGIALIATKIGILPGIILLGVGIFWMIGTSALFALLASLPSPGGFPGWAAVVLGILVVAFIMKRRRSSHGYRR